MPALKRSLHFQVMEQIRFMFSESFLSRHYPLRAKVSFEGNKARVKIQDFLPLLMKRLSPQLKRQVDRKDVRRLILDHLPVDAEEWIGIEGIAPFWDLEAARARVRTRTLVLKFKPAPKSGNAFIEDEIEAAATMKNIAHFLAPYGPIRYLTKTFHRDGSWNRFVFAELFSAKSVEAALRQVETHCVLVDPPNGLKWAKLGRERAHESIVEESLTGEAWRAREPPKPEPTAQDIEPPAKEPPAYRHFELGGLGSSLLHPSTQAVSLLEGIVPVPWSRSPSPNARAINLRTHSREEADHLSCLFDAFGIPVDQCKRQRGEEQKVDEWIKTYIARAPGPKIAGLVGVQERLKRLGAGRLELRRYDGESDRIKPQGSAEG